MPTTSNFGWTTPADTDLVKDGAAAIRTLGNGIDTSFLDLKGGTTNQVLAKNSNTDLDFKWVADATGIPATIFDAKGDLIVATAADTADRLASSGVNNEVLTVDTSTASGLKWAAVNVTPNFQLINTGGTALTGATTITVSGISSKNSLFIAVEGVSSANASSEFQLRFNSDTATNYAYAGLSLEGATPGATFDTARTRFEIAGQGNAAGNAANIYITVNGANSAGIKPVQINSEANGTTTDKQYAFNGMYKGSSAISSVSIISTSGNFDAGTIYVYGA